MAEFANSDVGPYLIFLTGLGKGQAGAEKRIRLWPGDEGSDNGLKLEELKLGIDSPPSPPTLRLWLGLVSSHTAHTERPF